MKLPWKRYPKRRGAGILTVLVASTLLLLMAFTVAGTSFHHLSVSNRLHHAQTARNLAEAALGKAVAELMVKHDKYQGAIAQDFQPIPNASSPAGLGGLLAFDPSNLATYNANLRNMKLEASVNNFGSDAPLTVNGRTLPGESAYLRAVGVDHGVERSMECIIYIPKFPWSVASGGKVEISGVSRVSAFKEMADVNDLSKELPGHLVANSNAAADAVVLQGNQITVTGDAQASGGADFGQNVVRGERRLHAQAVAIPDIDISAYNTVGQPHQPIPPGIKGAGADSHVSGLAHSAGPVTYNQGLHFDDGGVLYVDGDITINGEISGEGAIISQGKVTITGKGQLNSNNQVAILAGGDLTLQGAGSNDRLQLSGIVYSEGKVTTDYTSIYGNTVSPSGAGMSLKDTSLVSVDSAKHPVIHGPGTAGKTEAPASFAFNPEIIPPLVVVDLTAMPPSAMTIDPQITATISRTLALFVDPATGEYMIRRQTTSAWDNTQPVPQALPPGMYKTIKDGTGFAYDVPAPTGPPALTNADFTLDLGGTQIAGDDPNMLSLVKSHALNVINQQLAAQGKPNLSGAPLASVNSQLDALFSGNKLIEKGAQGGIKASSIGINGLVPYGTGGATAGPVIFDLDLNQQANVTRYLSRAEKIRVLYWRDVLP